MIVGSKPVIVEFIHGDITKLNVDAVVNAANSYLKHGGGVAGAIVRAGGPAIQRESDDYVAKNGPVPPGGVAVTGAGNLPAKFVLHTVGPVGDQPGNDSILLSCLKTVVETASKLQLRSVAIPFIGTGIFGYPLESFVKVTANFIRDYLKAYSGSLERIIFCDIDGSKVEKLREHVESNA